MTLEMQQCYLASFDYHRPIRAISL